MSKPSYYYCAITSSIYTYYTECPHTQSLQMITDDFVYCIINDLQNLRIPDYTHVVTSTLHRSEFKALSFSYKMTAQRYIYIFQPSNVSITFVNNIFYITLGQVISSNINDMIISSNAYMNINDMTISSNAYMNIIDYSKEKLEAMVNDTIKSHSTTSEQFWQECTT